MTDSFAILFLSYCCRHDLGLIHKLLPIVDTKDVKDVYYIVSSYLHESKNSKFVLDTFEDVYAATDSAYYESLLNNVKIFTCHDESYPKSLFSLKDYPPVIFVKGKIRSDATGISLIGSREHSIFAYERIHNIMLAIRNLPNINIISGLALGIDNIAHKQAIANNLTTTAVLPSSLDSIYPKSAIRLAYNVVMGGGALISELPPGVNRGKKAFIDRNRIVAAMSAIVMPIEMGAKSGTMSTVNRAFSLRKKIVVLKYDTAQVALPSYQGFNELDPEKIVIIDSADDIKKFLPESEQGKQLSFFM